jgi:formyl-CoA transferase
MNLLAMLAGLHLCESTGRGCILETSQFGSAVFSSISRLVEVEAGLCYGPMGSARGNVVPDRIFICADREYIAVSAPSERSWDDLCGAIDRSDLTASPEYSSMSARVEHRESLEELLEGVFSTRSSDDWIGVLRTHRLPCVVRQLDGTTRAPV